jgi:hypothetical protein
MSIRLNTYPENDARFAAEAQGLLGMAGSETPERLEDRLRDKYPNVRVHNGISEGPIWRWYAYRDGRF